MPGKRYHYTETIRTTLAFNASTTKRNEKKERKQERADPRDDRRRDVDVFDQAVVRAAPTAEVVGPKNELEMRPARSIRQVAHVFNLGWRNKKLSVENWINFWSSFLLPMAGSKTSPTRRTLRARSPSLRVGTPSKRSDWSTPNPTSPIPPDGHAAEIRHDLPVIRSTANPFRISAAQTFS